ncbi:hypothetical protein SLS62_005412 [Diatrype stigma]|uniref:Small nuclear ribonucleoprotein Prp3 C-terminal domain-containing protein n=1 Tax=Diatrype stigma TaxID=117547 RepID=A0AAN9YNK1_9PEZI
MGPATTTPAAALLPKELMELQLGQIDLLIAMYPSEGEVLLEESARDTLDTLRDWCSGEEEDSGTTHRQDNNIPADVSVVLNLEVAEEGGPSASKRLQLDITWPLRCEGTAAETEPPNPRVRIRQPDWLSRAETSRLAAETIPPPFRGDDGDSADGDILGAIERLREAAVALGEAQSLQANTAVEEGDTEFSGTDRRDRDTDDPLVRAWFYFPSISTRAKRDDLVSHAPRHGLTGFLLAGKPGVLCLEGGARAIDAYMRFIKTESWGDIPAHQKKVSERWREVGAGAGGQGQGGPPRQQPPPPPPPLERAFADMTEITETLGGGAKRGERANRSDMKALEAWLVDRGLGEAFARVFI